MIRVINIKAKPIPAYDLYIGRANKWLNLPGSKWANPFPMKKESERAEVIAKYEEYIRRTPSLLAALPELRGQVLACYCAPRRCHGDVLVKLYEEFVGDE